MKWFNFLPIFTLCLATALGQAQAASEVAPQVKSIISIDDACPSGKRTFNFNHPSIKDPSGHLFYTLKNKNTKRLKIGEICDGIATLMIEESLHGYNKTTQWYLVNSKTGDIKKIIQNKTWDFGIDKIESYSPYFISKGAELLNYAYPGFEVYEAQTGKLVRKLQLLTTNRQGVSVPEKPTFWNMHAPEFAGRIITDSGAIYDYAGKKVGYVPPTFALKSGTPMYDFLSLFPVRLPPPSFRYSFQNNGWPTPNGPAPVTYSRWDSTAHQLSVNVNRDIPAGQKDRFSNQWVHEPISDEHLVLTSTDTSEAKLTKIESYLNNIDDSAFVGRLSWCDYSEPGVVRESKFISYNQESGKVSVCDLDGNRILSEKQISEQIVASSLNKTNPVVYDSNYFASFGTSLTGGAYVAGNMLTFASPIAVPRDFWLSRYTYGYKPVSKIVEHYQGIGTNQILTTESFPTLNESEKIQYAMSTVDVIFVVGDYLYSQYSLPIANSSKQEFRSYFFRRKINETSLGPIEILRTWINYRDILSKESVENLIFVKQVGNNLEVLFSSQTMKVGTINKQIMNYVDTISVTLNALIYDSSGKVIGTYSMPWTQAGFQQKFPINRQYMLQNGPWLIDNVMTINGSYYALTNDLKLAKGSATTPTIVPYNEDMVFGTDGTAYLKNANYTKISKISVPTK